MFQGGIGYKYWNSNQTAYIFKLVFSVIKDKKEKSEQFMGEENSEVHIGVDYGIESHIAFINYVSSYFIYPPYYNNETETSLMSFTFQFNLGVEFFINKNISLAGQYSIGGFYKFGKEKIISNTVDDSRQINVLNTGISFSSLILSLYL